MEIIHRKAAVQKAFSKIGKSNGSAPPESTSNTFGPAYELFVASELRSAANKRYDVAKATCVELGILDEEKAVEGAEIAVYKTQLFDVTMKKAASGTTLDRVKLKNALSKRGMSEKDLIDILKEGSKPKKGAVTIGFSLKG